MQNKYIKVLDPNAHEIALSTDNLKVRYGENEVVHGISLPFERFKIISLIGASGSGKSTFLRSLNRMNDEVSDAIVTGQINYRDLDINNDEIDIYKMREQIGMVFQRPNPFAKSIYDNIIFALKQHGIKNKDNYYDEVVETTLKEAALWDQVKDKLNTSALSLSGGQQQRLCIARTLALKPDILLMDEPASALDPISTSVVEESLIKLRERYTIIIVTHNMQQASRISDYTAFFHLGDAIEFDETRKIFTNPKIKLTNDYITGNFG